MSILSNENQTSTTVMGIFAEPGEIELVVTWVCNWHCSYCAVDTHNRPRLNITDVMGKIQTIRDGSIVTISGGEVGSMLRSHVEDIITALKNKQCKLRLNTNGLFLKRYPDLVCCFDLVLYHCSEDLDPRPIVRFEFSQIEYMIIVTDRNMHKLEKFLAVNPDIEFHIVASTLPNGISGDVLSTRNRYSVITKFHTRMTHQSKVRMFKEKDFDAITYL